MSFGAKQDLKNILHPYLFILKEGGKIQKDLLDYSLVMLLMNSTETIKSPKNKKKIVTNLIDTVEMTLPTSMTFLGNNTLRE